MKQYSKFFSFFFVGILILFIGIFITQKVFALDLVSIQGSQFEIEDPGTPEEPKEGANLKFDGELSYDWANVSEQRKNDLPSGSNDDSFGTGTKEDTAIPTIVTGSIPPNKSDLKTFGVYLEQNQNGKFMHLFWSRVQDPKGTTNMDFEFNQSETLSSNGVTPERTPGDLLIVYDLDKGGTRPQFFRYTWLDGTEGISCEASSTFPCWGDKTDLLLYKNQMADLIC